MTTAAKVSDANAIPARNPDGSPNPEYGKEYRRRRAAAGYPVPRSKRSAETIRKWNESEAGKAARARYYDNLKSKGIKRNKDQYLKESAAVFEKRTMRELRDRYKYMSTREDDCGPM